MISLSVLKQRLGWLQEDYNKLDLSTANAIQLQVEIKALQVSINSRVST